MASTAEQGLRAVSTLERRPASHFIASDEDEKPTLSGTEYNIDSGDGDEALKLVGKERRSGFSEEDNLRLRRNWVSGYCRYALPFTSLQLCAQNGLTSVFGGFAAYGISFYDDQRTPPYKICYLLLGGLAILVGICVLLCMPDSPVHAQLLSQDERIAALERVRDDQSGTENKTLKKEQVKEALTDVRTWLIALSTLLISIPNGGMSNFGSQTVKSFGYTTRQTLILGTPGGLITAVTTLLCGWYSDKKGERMIPIVIAIFPTIVGMALMIGLNGHHGAKGLLLSGVYFTGTYGSTLSTVYAWNASNTSGHTRKITINAMTLAMFGVGNIVGTEIFIPKDAPAYIPGKIAIMVLLT
ncbi:MFS general substrate transporter [Artomyces pyxidatus]|uniref:MFS general substrate transporter n=1 Tax=Artomyces pyxidatus TaxID=48021 RepID=A0ACB8TL26_9AGAM|nr:MFS general substrate transporter [Artomyces pyxidatus]